MVYEVLVLCYFRIASYSKFIAYPSVLCFFFSTTFPFLF